MILLLTFALLQIVRNKTRLLVALAGIGFAVILIFLQLGFMNALYEAAMAPHKSIKADLVLLNTQSKVLFALESFPRERIYQAQRVKGVKSVASLYVGLGQWKNPDNHTKRSLLVYAFDPAQSVFKFPEIVNNLNDLKMTNRILFDKLSRREFGAIAKNFNQGYQVSTELEGVRVEVAGLFSLGASFAADGNVITSDSTFLHIFKGRSINKINVGLITLEPNANPQAVIKTLTKILPNDVKAMTLEDFALSEKHYWETSAAIGFIFGLGVIMGFMVGAIIVYQILYADVSDHLAEYATLKAMGYPHSFLLNVVFQESLILAVLGYIPGFLISELMYDLTRRDTNLPVFMTPSLALFVLVLTIAMCFLAGTIAMRKLQSADPADICF
jgi:putative ABC transport system permease protein